MTLKDIVEASLYDGSHLHGEIADSHSESCSEYLTPIGLDDFGVLVVLAAAAAQEWRRSLLPSAGDEPFTFAGFLWTVIA
jgi:hypothetical protein